MPQFAKQSEGGDARRLRGGELSGARPAVSSSSIAADRPSDGAGAGHAADPAADSGRRPNGVGASGLHGQLRSADFRRYLPYPSVFEARRAASLAAGVAAASVVGCIYAFSVLSDPMKNQFGLDQSKVDLIATVAFMLAMFNLPAGMLYDRFGARLVIIVAFTGITLGMGLMAAIFAGYIPGTVTTLLLSYALACWPSGCIDIATLMPNLYTFPLNRGDVVIIQKTFMGLGASIFATIFACVFGDDYVAWYCVVCSGSAAIAGGLAATFIVSGQDIERFAGVAFASDGTATPVPRPHAVAEVVSDEEDGHHHEGNPDGSRGPLLHNEASSSALTEVGLLPVAEAEKVLQARGSAFRLATTPAPPTTIRVGFALLAVAFLYLIGCQIAGIAKWLPHWPIYVRIIIALGTVGIVGVFWVLVPIARATAAPLASTAGPSDTQRTAVSQATSGGAARAHDGYESNDDDTYGPDRMWRDASAPTTAAAPSGAVGGTSTPRLTPPHYPAGGGVGGIPAALLYNSVGSRAAHTTDLSDPVGDAPAVVGSAPSGPKPRPVQRSALIRGEAGKLTPRTAAAAAVGQDPNTSTSGDATTGGAATSHQQQPDGRHRGFDDEIGRVRRHHHQHTNTAALKRTDVVKEEDPMVAPFSTSTSQLTPPANNGRTTVTGPRGTFAETAVPFEHDSPLSALLSLPFVLLYVTLFFQLASGTVISMNGAQIYRAVNNNEFNAVQNAALAGVGGVGSAAGRVVAGLADRYLPRYSTTAFFLVPSVINGLAMFSFLFLPTAGLFVSFFLSQLGYGMAWALVIMGARLAYKSAIVGTVYAMLFTSGILATCVFNLGMFGPLYDREASAQHVEKGCNGVQCFAVTLVVLGAGNLASVLSAVAFHRAFMGWQRSARIEEAMAAAAAGGDPVAS